MWVTMPLSAPRLGSRLWGAGLDIWGRSLEKSFYWQASRKETDNRLGTTKAKKSRQENLLGEQGFGYLRGGEERD